MLFWILTAALTAAVLLYVLAPLARAGHIRVVYSLSMVIAVMVLAFYSWLGNPMLPDQPAAPRQARQAQALAQIADGITKLRAGLALEPNDVAGWTLLGSSETALGHDDAAANAFDRAASFSNGEAKANLQYKAGAARLTARYKAGKAAWIAGDRTGMEANWRPLLDQLLDSTPIRAEILQKLDAPR